MAACLVRSYLTSTTSVSWSLLTEDCKMRSVSFCRVVLALLPALLFVASSRVQADVKLPDGKMLEAVDFERHIMGILGRTGCAGGSCHGSFQGKGGFRLSLFGYDPDKDYVAITRDSNARRINP